MEGIQNFKNRKTNVEIPSETMDQVVGFSHETINYLLGGIFRASYRPLNDNIINGRIRGIAGVVGCNNARVTHDDPNLTLIKELIKNDVIVLVTGCSAMTCGKAGLLTPEAARYYAGAGPRLRLGGGWHSSRSSHGRLRRQQPDPDGGHSRRQGRRTRG